MTGQEEEEGTVSAQPGAPVVTGNLTVNVEPLPGSLSVKQPYEALRPDAASASTASRTS
jgi:hypothetical protein